MEVVHLASLPGAFNRRRAVAADEAQPEPDWTAGAAPGERKPYSIRHEIEREPIPARVIADARIGLSAVLDERNGQLSVSAQKPIVRRWRGRRRRGQRAAEVRERKGEREERKGNRRTRDVTGAAHLVPSIAVD